MPEVDIYIESNIRGRAESGSVIYILAYTDEGGKTATKTKKLDFTEARRHSARLKAINEAYGRLKPGCTVRLWVDDEYIKSTIESGILKKWQEAGWKNSKGKDVDAEWVQAQGNITNFKTEVFANARHSYKVWMTRELAPKEKSQKPKGEFKNV